MIEDIPRKKTNLRILVGKNEDIGLIEITHPQIHHFELK